MVTFNLHVKSGTGGYSDYDACDLSIFREIEAETLPRIGEKISFIQKVKEQYVTRFFLVTDINYHIGYICNDNRSNVNISNITVCGIPVDGKPAFLDKE